MRGEDMIGRRKIRFALGSPPHARGRQADDSLNPQLPRITPACAGKTPPPPGQTGQEQDHPRMRGEDFCSIYCFGLR